MNCLFTWLVHFYSLAISKAEKVTHEHHDTFPNFMGKFSEYLNSI